MPFYLREERRRKSRLRHVLCEQINAREDNQDRVHRETDNQEAHGCAPVVRTRFRSCGNSVPDSVGSATLNGLRRHSIPQPGVRQALGTWLRTTGAKDPGSSARNGSGIDCEHRIWQPSGAKGKKSAEPLRKTGIKSNEKTAQFFSALFMG